MTNINDNDFGELLLPLWIHATWQACNNSKVLPADVNL